MQHKSFSHDIFVLISGNIKQTRQQMLVVDGPLNHSEQNCLRPLFASQ